METGLHAEASRLPLKTPGKEMVMESILETYPDAHPKSLTVGDDNYIHFLDGFGESWCATAFSTYYLDDLGENLEFFETVDDGPMSSFCPGCKEGADDEKQESAAEANG